MNDQNEFTRMAGMVSEGHCPRCGGRLEPRQIQHLPDMTGLFGFCAPCDNAYRLRRATEDEDWLGLLVLEQAFHVVATETALPFPTTLTTPGGKRAPSLDH
jgi:hypothetical protein